MNRPSIRGTLLIVGAFALGAAATATAGLLITGSQIKDGTVASADLKNNNIAGIDIKNNTIASADVRDGSLTAADINPTALASLKGDKGDPGAKGDKGDPGSLGALGSSGAPGPSLLIGAGGGVNPGGTSFHTVTGGNFGNLEGAQAPVPPGVGLTARDFIANIRTAPGAGQSVTVTFMLNGAPTALSCTIAGTATQCQAPGTATLALPAGALMAMQNTATAGVPVINSVGWSMRVVF